MRFVVYAALFILLASPAIAAPGDQVTMNDNSAKPAVIHLGKQIRTSKSQLQTIDSLRLTEAATGLGQISAMALAGDGTLYAAEEKRGRLWQLTDRNQDGVFEHRRPLPHSFSGPSAIAVMDETIYVADRSALWVIEPLAPKRQLASLAQSQSTDGKYFLTAQDGRLILGLNTIGGQTRLIDVDVHTGTARLMRSYDGKITALAGRGVNALWLGLGSKLGASNTSISTETGRGTTLTGLQLPAHSGSIKNWPQTLDNHIIAAQAGAGAMRLLAIPTEFGQPAEEAFILVDGFIVQSGRNAWGQPGPMVMDKRGLFFLDSWNGTVWHLWGQPPLKKDIVKIIEPVEKPAEPNLASIEKPEPKPLLKGSGIGSASTIERASSLKTGSVLKKNFDDKKQKDHEAKKAAK